MKRRGIITIQQGLANYIAMIEKKSEQLVEQKKAEQLKKLEI